MRKEYLLKMCKEMNIKAVSSKNKEELVSLIRKKKEELVKSEANPLLDDVQLIKSEVNPLFEELIKNTPKDKHRKVCKNFNELGHTVTSTECKLNIEKNKKLRDKIKKYILSQNCLEDKTTEEYCVELSVVLDITPNHCRLLYNEIPLDDLLDRKIDFTQYLVKEIKKCYECDTDLLIIQINTHRIWKNTDICDSCWCKYSQERKIIWEQIKKYKQVQCVICSNVQKYKEERFHYDHLNMFDKNKSVCTMVNEGINIEEIYDEIYKCQIVCLQCHHMVTDIEHKLGFTRIKQSLTYNITFASACG